MAQFEIVGVVRDEKYNSVREPAPPTMYRADLQAADARTLFRGPHGGRSRPRHRPSARRCGGWIRTLPVTNVSTQTRKDRGAVLRRSGSSRRRIAVRRARAGAGVDRSVRPDELQRGAPHERDRHAHGARRAARSTCVRLVMSESMRLVFVGIAVGAAAAVAAGHFVTALLFGVQPTDSSPCSECGDDDPGGGCSYLRPRAPHESCGAAERDGRAVPKPLGAARPDR